MLACLGGGIPGLCCELVEGFAGEGECHYVPQRGAKGENPHGQLIGQIQKETAPIIVLFCTVLIFVFLHGIKARKSTDSCAFLANGLLLLERQRIFFFFCFCFIANEGCRRSLSFLIQ